MYIKFEIDITYFVLDIEIMLDCCQTDH